jgi:hypothetical protein
MPKKRAGVKNEKQCEAQPRSIALVDLAQQVAARTS